MSDSDLSTGGTNSAAKFYNLPTNLGNDSSTLINTSSGSINFTSPPQNINSIYGDLTNNGTVSFIPSSSGDGSSFYLGSSSNTLIQEDGTLTFSQTDATSGPSVYLKYGTINNDATSIINLEASNAATISAPSVENLTNAGTIRVVDTNGTGMTSNWGGGETSKLTNSGTFTIDDSSKTSGSTINMNFGGGITNTGKIGLTYSEDSTSIWNVGEGGLNNSGVLSFQSHMTASTPSNIQIESNGNITNTGNIKLFNTNTNFNHDIEGEGTIRLLNSSKVILSSSNTTASNQIFNFSGGNNILDISSSNIASTFSGKIRGFIQGDQIYSGLSGVISYDKITGFLTITTAGNQTYTYDVGHNYPGTFSDSDNGIITYTGSPPCYLAGTMIRTPTGEVAVETIQAGDIVMTYDIATSTNIAKKVVWAGAFTVTVTSALTADEARFPVRICKDAFKDNVPEKDLLVTAEHCMFINGKLIPARMLVNGRSVFYDRTLLAFTVYHIETEKRAILIANNTLSESFLNTENHGYFRRSGKRFSLNASPSVTWAEAAAPLEISQEGVEPIFNAISTRAEAAGVSLKTAYPALTSDSDLHLVTKNNMAIRPLRKVNGYAIFIIPEECRMVRIVSNASRPCDVIGPFVDDRRILGVLVGDAQLFETCHFRILTAHLEDKSLKGWQGVEKGNMRWTTGNAFFDLGGREPGTKALLALQIWDSGPYILTGATKHKENARGFVEA